VNILIPLFFIRSFAETRDVIIFHRTEFLSRSLLSVSFCKSALIIRDWVYMYIGLFNLVNYQTGYYLIVCLFIDLTVQRFVNIQYS